MSRPGPVHCGHGCGRQWPRDPALEVACPTCQAPVGQRCRRPSDHRTWGKEPHPTRDLLADQQGCYGPCPLGHCGQRQRTLPLDHPAPIR